MKNFNQKRGFVQAIVTIVITLVLLSLFGVDLEERFKSPLIQKNLQFTWSLVQSGWKYAWDGFTEIIYGKGSAGITAATTTTKSLLTNTLPTKLY